MGDYRQHAGANAPGNAVAPVSAARTLKTSANAPVSASKTEKGAKMYKGQRVGSRAQVWHGTADITAANKKGLTKVDLTMNPRGHIVSKKQREAGKVAFENLKKLGFAPVPGKPFIAFGKDSKPAKTLKKAAAPKAATPKAASLKAKTVKKSFKPRTFKPRTFKQRTFKPRTFKPKSFHKKPSTHKAATIVAPVAAPNAAPIAAAAARQRQRQRS